MQRARRRIPAFTLIELIVTVTIIGILAALSLGPISAARVRSRDARRKADINILAQGIDLYYATTRTLPTDLADCSTTPIYRSYIPVDPSNPTGPWIPNLPAQYLINTTGKIQPHDPREDSQNYYYTYECDNSSSG